MVVMIGLPNMGSMMHNGAKNIFGVIIGVSPLCSMLVSVILLHLTNIKH